jgi:xanthine dehydrogenase accessory factor
MKMMPNLTELVTLIKGGGEVASAVAHKLACSDLRVCLTETPFPQAVHCGTTFCEAIYEGEKEVEGVVAKLITSPEQAFEVWDQNKIPIIVDAEALIKDFLHPNVLIDAIMAKRNLGTKFSDAPLVIGLGPGFRAGRDVHIVVETNHGENLGKKILQGEAESDTGIPMDISGFTFERALHASMDGRFLTLKRLGDSVSVGEIVAFVAGQPVKAEIGGILRGLLRDGLEVKKGTKLGEIDPQGSKEACYTIRPKMKTIADGVLEAILMHYSSEGCF